MAYLGSLVCLIAIVGAVFYRRRSLERHRWFLWTGVVNMFFPFIAAIAGWCLTEFGRQPWIVQGLLETAKANSPAVSTTWIVISLTVFVSLYVALLVLDIYLMRRFARREPAAEPEAGGEAMPAIGY